MEIKLARNEVLAWRHWGIVCLVKWLAIREENGIALPSSTSQLMADIDHSSLLNRLLIGMEPLPEKPPLEDGYPVYPKS